MSQSLTRLSLLAAVLSIIFTLLPSFLAKQKDPGERLLDTVEREGAAILDALRGVEEPAFVLRFDGPHLWPSLAVITGALAFVLGLIPVLGGGGDRFAPGIAALIGVAVVAWQIWGQ